MGRKKPDEQPAEIQPTPERAQRREVERWRGSAGEKTMQDADGAAGSPFRAIDSLTMMRRRGTITPEMLAAGERFRDDFDQASFDPLRCSDIARVPSGLKQPGITTSAQAARDRLWAALKALGGHTSPKGSITLHTLGFGWTVKGWTLTSEKKRAGNEVRDALYRRSLKLMREALDGLAAHYGIVGRRKQNCRRGELRGHH